MGYINRRNAERRIERHDIQNCPADNVVTTIPIDFSNPDDEIQAERDFRMLQSMYSKTAKALLPYIEEECDKMEYEGSAMYDEYPDFTTVYSIQQRIAGAAGEDSADELIRVMLLQEMHRRRSRHFHFTRDAGQ
ncbi:MAG: hypothetical protein LUH07_15755 [Lachnospiraceae bacterium]|nr:hypothetical protein [Lachnospiraceae bacterium]